MTSREHQDPYVVLGVLRQASPDEIARAYRRAARATHPDGGGSRAGAERFRAVSDAYDMLRDPARRAAYDRLHAPPRPESPRAGGSARYAAPGSQHVVLGAQPERRELRLGDDDVRSGRLSGDADQLLAAVLSLLRRSR
jgi:curved DNA-binding protein CbpA